MSNAVGSDLIVEYDPEQRKLYERNDPCSIFWAGRNPIELRGGIYRHGRFPEIAVRASFRALGFSVLISEPRMPNDEGFVLAHYAGKRKKQDPAYIRMFAHFDQAKIEEFNQAADRAKIDATGNRGGGDPDLFVFCRSGDAFFVEVKKKGEPLYPNQLATFPLINSILNCKVHIARIKPVAAARPVDLGRTITACTA